MKIFLSAVLIAAQFLLNSPFTHAGGEVSRDQPVNAHYFNYNGWGGAGSFGGQVQHPGGGGPTMGGHTPEQVAQLTSRIVYQPAPAQVAPSVPSAETNTQVSNAEPSQPEPEIRQEVVAIETPVDLKASFKKELNQIQDRLDQAHPIEENRVVAKRLGTEAVQEADHSYENGSVDDAHFWKNLATEFADIAVGIDPVSGLGRGAYELTTGTNLITGEKLNNFERGLAFVAVVTAGGSNSIIKTSNAMIRLGSKTLPHAAPGILKGISTGRNIIHGLKNSVKSSVFRNAPGVATVKGALRESPTLFRGSHNNAGFVPKDVGDKLVGKKYRNFKQFRKSFWKAVSESKYAESFNLTDKALMTKGNAPMAAKSQRMGGKSRYELHHMTPIHQGGAVYELNNIIVVTPKFHEEILTRAYHYGK